MDASGGKGRLEVDLHLNVNSEQRQYLRYQILDYASVFLPGSAEPVPAMLTDIGLGGAQVRSQLPMPVEGRITIRLAGGSGKAVDLPAEVRHCTQVEGTSLYGSGVRFMPKTHAQKMALAEFVHAVFQRQSDRLAG